MKRLIVIAFIGLYMTVFAQDDIPVKVEEAFKTKFPNAKLDNWTVNNELYSLEYYLKSDYYTSVFDQDGLWKETSEIISDDEIPVSLKDYLKMKYSGGIIFYTEKVIDNSNKNFIRVNFSINNEEMVVKCDMSGKNIEILNNKIEK